MISRWRDNTSSTSHDPHQQMKLTLLPWNCSKINFFWQLLALLIHTDYLYSRFTYLFWSFRLCWAWTVRHTLAKILSFLTDCVGCKRVHMLSSKSRSSQAFHSRGHVVDLCPSQLTTRAVCKLMGAHYLSHLYFYIFLSHTHHLFV